MTTYSHLHLTLFTLLLACGQLCRAQEVNPDYTYFLNGDTPQGWHWVVGDPDNWWQPLEANIGKSASGKLTIAPTTFKEKNDAIKATWKKSNTFAALALTGRTTNLAAFEDKAELVIVARVDRKPTGPVKLAMHCGENCKGEIEIQEQLNQAERKRWMVIPIALNCLTEAGVKLDNLTSPLWIGTNSRLEIAIASVQIQAMGEGEKGCK